MNLGVRRISRLAEIACVEESIAEKFSCVVEVFKKTFLVMFAEVSAISRFKILKKRF